MSAEALISRTESLGIRLQVNGDKLRVVAQPGTLTPELRQALREHKAELLAILRADAQAREAGLAVLASGRLYHAAPSRLSGVFVERVGDLWEAYAVTWRPERQGGGSRLVIASDRTLYRGKELRRALQAAAKWAKPTTPEGQEKEDAA